MQRVSPLPRRGRPVSPAEGQLRSSPPSVGVVFCLCRCFSLFPLQSGPLGLLIVSCSPVALKVLPHQSLYFSPRRWAARDEGAPARTVPGRACDAAGGRELDLSLGHFRTYGVRHA